ncbi:MAG: hypothetical protein MZV70_55050 [Desulfobacterales bacterium]|nr:hypothetical protein [Desulfobacterales bacterium]
MPFIFICATMRLPPGNRHFGNHGPQLLNIFSRADLPLVTGDKLNIDFSFIGNLKSIETHHLGARQREITFDQGIFGDFSFDIGEDAVRFGNGGAGRKLYLDQDAAVVHGRQKLTPQKREQQAACD